MGSWDSLAYVTVEVSSAPPDDPNPVWVDITSYVLTVSRAQPMQVDTGRQNELSGTDPSRATLTLNNADDRFTSGYTGSPYYPWWKQGRKVRIRETVGYRTYDAITGYLQMPEVRVGLPVNVDNLVTVSIVDRLARLDTSRKFIGTLAEYILYNGGSTLKAYWPCNENARQFRDATGNGLPSIQQYGNVTSTYAITSQASLLLPAQGSPVFADDTPTAALQSALGVNGSLNVATSTPDMRAQFLGLSIPSSQVLTVVIWLNGNPPPTPYDLTTFGLTLATVNTNIVTALDASSILSVSAAGAFSGGGTAATFPVTGWTPLAIRYGWSPAVLEVWIGTRRFTYSLSGSPPASDALVNILLPSGQGSFGHMQAYLGTASAWDLPQLTAQTDAARTCLSGQYTGDRIKTIGLYAGIPASDLSDVDKGVAMMGKAGLAGQSATAEMKLAETAEQGRLRFDGRGRLIFDDRIARYNV